MDDTDIVHRINELAEEEHGLERAHEGQELSSQEVERLRQIEVALDQCWDLLRQRRALREFGRNPEEARLRDEKTVEGYEG